MHTLAIARHPLPFYCCGACTGACSDCRRIMLSRSGERPASSISAASCMRSFLVGLLWVLTARGRSNTG